MSENETRIPHEGYYGVLEWKKERIEKTVDTSQTIPNNIRKGMNSLVDAHGE